MNMKKVNAVEAVEWVANPHVQTSEGTQAVDETIPPGIARLTRSFHRQIPGYRITPLKGLGHLASMLGVGGIWVS